MRAHHQPVTTRLLRASHIGPGVACATGPAHDGGGGDVRRRVAGRPGSPGRGPRTPEAAMPTAGPRARRRRRAGAATRGPRRSAPRCARSAGRASRPSRTGERPRRARSCPAGSRPDDARGVRRAVADQQPLAGQRGTVRQRRVHDDSSVTAGRSKSASTAANSDARPRSRQRAPGPAKYAPAGRRRTAPPARRPRGTRPRSRA